MVEWGQRQVGEPHGNSLLISQWTLPCLTQLVYFIPSTQHPFNEQLISQDEEIKGGNQPLLASVLWTWRANEETPRREEPRSPEIRDTVGRGRLSKDASWVLKRKQQPQKQMSQEDARVHGSDEEVIPG